MYEYVLYTYFELVHRKQQYKCRKHSKQQSPLPYSNAVYDAADEEEPAQNLTQAGPHLALGPLQGVRPVCGEL